LPKLVITEEMRSSLKKPLGRLLAGQGAQIYREISRLISRNRPPRVIFVGDAVSRGAVAAHLRRDLIIVDGREMRLETKPVRVDAKRTFRVRNDPGTIALDALAAVESAVQSGNAMIVVDGEEDLLALVAIAVAPTGSFVMYGQPSEGIVLVEVDNKTRENAIAFFDCMTRAE